MLSSALDLSAVYGADDNRATMLREMANGRMKVSDGNYLPYNTAGLSNAPRPTREFFVAGDHRSNEHPVLTAIHIIFLREHNRLAAALALKFPDWDDERLYQNARKINGAQFQKIVFKEFYPSMTGGHLRLFSGHDESANPTVSALFTSAAFRLGHTMVGNGVNRLGAGGEKLAPLSMADMFFKKNIEADGVEMYLRGAAAGMAQESDNEIHNALRDFLFEGTEEERGFDLAALNIQRGRDHGLPSFNNVRSQLKLRPYTSFAEITENVNLQSALADAYKTVDRIEPWVGMICEKHAARASMGPTMLKIWEESFKKLRDGDRFYYEIRNQFSPEIENAVPEVKTLRSERDTFMRIILENTKVQRSELPVRMFFVAKQGGPSRY